MRFKITALLMFSLSLQAKERIVSAGGSVTEILYALGLGDEIIAVDTSSMYPEAATKKSKIGYFRQLSAEGVLSLNPTLVVATNGAGPEETLKHIVGAGVEIKVFSQERYTIENWSDHILAVGDYFGKTEGAKAIVDRVKSAIKQVKPVDKKALFLIGWGDRGPVAAGHNTVPDMLFRLAGMQNLVTEFEGFKPYSVEALIKGGA